MAYQLKTSGIATACTMLIAVDPDTGTVKDFASSAVTADMTVGANVTIGSQSWDGNTRYYAQLGSSGDTTSAAVITFGTTKPHWANNVAGMTRTWVWCGEAQGTSPRAFGKDSSHYAAGRNIGAGGNTLPQQVGMGYPAGATGGNAPLAAGDKAIFGLSTVFGTSGFAYTALHNAASMTVTNVGAPSATTSAGVYDIPRIGAHGASFAHSADKIHFVAIFDAALSEAEWDSLRDDWFTVLLEPAGGGGGSSLPAKLHHLRMQGICA
jgi:hypothetical protein